ncbi:MAG: condensation domain-containing protein, partial [Tumebacillaceae bacterium]
CTEADAGDGEIITLGKPFDNNRVYILDAYLQPVPVGVAGDLYIAGIGLARGYLNNLEKTAEAFLPNPFATGETIYKTGDRGRYRADGSIDFLGREDNQVKIRGIRVELGEIENVLAQHQAVKEALILAHTFAEGDKRLVAYVVPETGMEITGDALQSDLKTKLPEYMVPALYILLDVFPLNANGKVDRRSLPIPSATGFEAKTAYVAPRTPVEELLERMFGQVLHHENVGVHDNFFDLGGHSLLATQVVSRIRHAFQIALPVRDLFDHPTIAGLAERVQRAMNDGRSLQEHPIQRVSRTQQLPLSFAQQRLWFLDQLDPGSATYNVPMALRLRGPLDVEALEHSLGEIVQRHESLRTTFAEHEGQAVQVVANATAFALPVLDVTAHAEREREALVSQWLTEEIRWSFDLVNGPLFRARLLCLQAEEAVLFLNLHHIVTDGWSMNIFIQELSALYEAFQQGQASSLPDVSVQYADFAAWQRDWLQGDELVRQLTYWQEKLGGELPVLQLPTDRPRPKRQTYRGSLHSFVIPAPLVAKIKAISKREEATLFMTMLAAYKTLLYRYTGQEDLLIGTPIANRNRRELEGVIGFFVNTLVMRTDLSGNPSFRELVRRLRDVALGAYTHQDLPFEKLVEELHPERDMSHSPLFQAMFAMQNHASQTLQLNGLDCEQLDVEYTVSKFDITLFVEEQADELVCGFEYNTDLFDAATLARMAAHFVNLLEGLVEHPQRGIATLPLMNAQEQQRMIVEWNETDASYPQSLCLHELVEEQVERTPQLVAAVYGDQELTYQELNEQANRLAHHLQAQGAGPDVP